MVATSDGHLHFPSAQTYDTSLKTKKSAGQLSRNSPDLSLRAVEQNSSSVSDDHLLGLMASSVIYHLVCILIAFSTAKVTLIAKNRRKNLRAT